MSDELSALYEQVEYIESTGEQYIDTGYIFSTQNIKCEIKYQQLAVLNNAYLLGSNTEPNRSIQFGISTFYNKYRAIIKGLTLFSNIDIQVQPVNVVIEREGKNLLMQIGADTVSSTSSDNEPGIANVPLYLFASNNNGVSTLLNTAKLYHCGIYDDNTLVRNFIPCYRKADNKPGLLDLVNEVFYTNANTEASVDFSVGSAVLKYIPQKVQVNILKSKLPKEYQQAEYIESTGEQYVDTGYAFGSAVSIEAKIRYTSLTDGRNGVFQSSSTRKYFGVSSNKWIVGYGSNYDHNLGTADKDVHIFKYGLTEFSIDGNTLKSYSGLPNASANVGLFRLLGAQGGYSSSEELYSCQIYDDNVLVRNFIPCYRKSDNKPGLYDTVNDVFYTNANTSATTDFTVGSIIPHSIISI